MIAYLSQECRPVHLVQFEALRHGFPVVGERFEGSPEGVRLPFGLALYPFGLTFLPMGFVLINGQQVHTSFLPPLTEDERLEMYRTATYEPPVLRLEAIEWMKDFVSKQVELPPEAAAVIDENFLDLASVQDQREHSKAEDYEQDQRQTASPDLIRGRSEGANDGENE